MATVLIVGASRGIGLETVKRALGDGHVVRALARSARRIRIDHPNLTRLAADARDRAALAGALGASTRSSRRWVCLPART